MYWAVYLLKEGTQVFDFITIITSLLHNIMYFSIKIA